MCEIVSWSVIEITEIPLDLALRITISGANNPSEKTV
jgi:hypothetical protein